MALNLRFGEEVVLGIEHFISKIFMITIYSMHALMTLKKCCVGVTCEPWVEAVHSTLFGGYQNLALPSYYKWAPMLQNY